MPRRPVTRGCARWDRLLVRRGLELIDRIDALRGTAGPYALQAAIAACHARAATAEETDWVRIAALYDGLVQVVPSPVVELNRAVAVGRAFGAEAGLEMIAPLRSLPALASYHLLSAVAGDLQCTAGMHEQAREGSPPCWRVGRRCPRLGCLRGPRRSRCRPREGCPWLLGGALAASLVGSWFVDLILRRPDQVPDWVNRIAQVHPWVSGIALGVVLAVFGYRPASRLVGWLVALAIAWVVPSVLTAMVYATSYVSQGSLRGEQLREVADAGRDVFVQSLSPGNHITGPLVAAVAIGVVGATWRLNRSTAGPGVAAGAG
ncbi:MAG: hypothetical protein ABIW49_04695 [Knoellia sp.]